MSREKLLEARNLIQSKCYHDAAAILRTLPGDPQAQKWLDQMKENGLISASVIQTIAKSPNNEAFQEFPEDDESLDQLIAQEAENHQGVNSTGLSVVDCVALGAVIAVAIAGFWVYSYLHGTVIGWTLLWDYVVGDAHGSDGFVSTEALFVVIARFLLGFGMFWGPSTLLVFFGSYIHRALT